MMTRNTNVMFVERGLQQSNNSVITKTFILVKNPISASFVQLVLQAEGIMECMKDHILVTRENLPNKEFMYSKYRNRHSRIRIFDKSISIRGFTKFDIKVL